MVGVRQQKIESWAKVDSLPGHCTRQRQHKHRHRYKMGHFHFHFCFPSPKKIPHCMEGLSLGLVYQMSNFHISCLMINILHLQIFYVSKYSRYILLHNSHLWDILCFKAPGQCTHPSGKVCHNILYFPPFFYWGHFLSFIISNIWNKFAGFLFLY